MYGIMLTAGGICCAFISAVVMASIAWYHPESMKGRRRTGCGTTRKG